jgi:hypothetical protein
LTDRFSLPNPHLLKGNSAMNNGKRLLPNLTVNRPFITEFVAAETPCFAMGMVSESHRQCGLLALRPDEVIPSEVTETGFNFGHSLFGNASFEVIHFAFEFYGFKTYNVVVNPNNPLVQAVLAQMIQGGDYFFFLLHESGGVTTFRAEVGTEVLSQLKANLARIQRSTTTEHQYRQALASFAVNPHPEGRLLNWVCREPIQYLSLTEDTIQLTPA